MRRIDAGVDDRDDTRAGHGGVGRGKSDGLGGGLAGVSRPRLLAEKRDDAAIGGRVEDFDRRLVQADAAGNLGCDGHRIGLEVPDLGIGIDLRHQLLGRPADASDEIHTVPVAIERAVNGQSMAGGDRVDAIRRRIDEEFTRALLRRAPISRGD